MVGHEKLIKRIYWSGIVLSGFIFGFAHAVLNLDLAKVFMLYLAWLVVALIVCMMVNYRWNREMARKIDELTPILEEECDPDCYIAKLNALTEGENSAALQQIKWINLSAAYCDKEEYQTAKDLILQVQLNKIGKMAHPVYWADLALIHFRLGETKEALDILEEQKETFAGLREDTHLGGTLALLAVFQQLALDHPREARSLLDELRPRWEKKRNKQEFDYLESRIQGAFSD